MTEKVKTFWEKHWGWIIQIVAMVFSAGVIYATVNEAIKNRPDRTELNITIDTKLQKHVNDSKEIYINIDRVPGLNENLQFIKSQVDDIKKSNDLILQKLMRGNK